MKSRYARRSLEPPLALEVVVDFDYGITHVKLHQPVGNAGTITIPPYHLEHVRHCAKHGTLKVGQGRLD